LKRPYRDKAISNNKLSERHPEKQGLKLAQIKEGDEIRKTFRAPSRKTRIETSSLKEIGGKGRNLSERHPEKQGLKHRILRNAVSNHVAFRAPSRKTRIETVRYICIVGDYRLSERHPEKQGLKLLCAMMRPNLR